MQLVKVILCFVLFCFARCNVSAQGMDWTKTTNWKLYNLRGQKGLGLSVDSLRHFKSVALSVDSLQYFLRFADQWPKHKTSMWMGGFAATYEIDGLIHKVDISMYAGFFYDETEQRYYQLTDSVREKWMEWLNGKMEELQAAN